MSGQNIKVQEEQINQQDLIDLFPPEIREHLHTLFLQQVSVPTLPQLNDKSFSDLLKLIRKIWEEELRFARLRAWMKFILILAIIIALTVLVIYLSNKNSEILKAFLSSIPTILASFIGLGLGLGGGILLGIKRGIATKHTPHEPTVF